MTTIGQACLLVAFIASGYAAFAGVVGWKSGHRAVRASGLAAALISLIALGAVSAILAWALVQRDFAFAYVVEYSDALLPWQYALSAFWVGQAGSLLLWALFLAVLAMLYRFWPGREPSSLREPAFALLMAYLWLLVTVMLFAADPMQPSLVASLAGKGLTPLLQHPAMLIHPPIIFLGYAVWGVPCVLALAALASGQIDVAWVRESRPWALAAWAILGAGILIGAEWAYEELGWGGYWSWDPIENGSLMPWLAGTALIHGLMTWHYVGALKKTTLALAIVTFALCNFATFLTRSGIFSSLHAFSQSPIGWIFLVGMVVTIVGGGALIARHRRELDSARPIASLCSREAWVVLATLAIALWVAAMLAGTLLAPLSGLLPSGPIAVGVAFYNNVLIPVGLLLLGLTATVPLLRWGGSPTLPARKALLAAVAFVLAFGLAMTGGVRHPLALVVAGLSTVAVVALVASAIADARGRSSEELGRRPLLALWVNRRQYAGFFIHLGVVALAIGITGSSLGTRSHDAVIHRGEAIQWAGYSIRYVDLLRKELPDKIAIEAKLDIAPDGGQAFSLLPAQHLHRLQNQWSSEVAIHSTWSGDFYTILHGGQGEDEVSVTLIENPLMRWLWLAGCIGCVGALFSLAACRPRAAATVPVKPPVLVSAIPAPHCLSRAHARDGVDD